ncbi:MAG: hypothetical protein D6808_01910 [Candidatus Dadabacteria bacterium]|nr:MAG: hypothetical protein D6808_01910 [Candidatus Dadabacteria bacterium]
MILTNPFVCLIYGRSIVAIVKGRECSFIKSSHLMTVGILSFIVVVFSLKLIGLPWSITTLIAYLPAIIWWKQAGQVLQGGKRLLSLNFVLWFAVHLAIGISLFDALDGIQTIWTNNYGDLAYHLGMITSFTLGDNFPPQNHLLAGTTLSYPFFINLWTASLWWPSARFYSLHLIFIYQWCFLWVLVYCHLNNSRYPLLPWAVLFAGGTYFTLGKHSGELIKLGYPWSVFLTTIWIPQRTSILGLATILSSLNLFWRYILDREKKSLLPALKLSAITLALSPLAHSHFFLVTAVVTSAILISTSPNRFREYAIYFAILAISLHSLYWIGSKSSIVRLSAGWITGTHGKLSLLDVASNSLAMWAASGWQWLIYFITIWCISKRHRVMLVMACAFIAANILHIAVWEWDQIKVFACLYVITLSLLSSQSIPKSIILNIALTLMIIPSLFELKSVLSENRLYKVYAAEDLSIAREVIANTKKGDILAAAPVHNSPATLTGRKLFMGFTGTLFSHGSRYKEREALYKNLHLILNCHKLYTNPRVCPNYLLWTIHEENRWKHIPYSKNLQKTPSPHLYKILHAR